MSFRKFIFALFLIIFILAAIIATSCGNVKAYGNAKLQNLLESIDSGNYANFKNGMHHDLEVKFTEEEFSKLASNVKDKYGDYKKYSTEFISSSTENRITTAYFYAEYSKNKKVKIMIKFSLEIEIYVIVDFRFED